MSIDPLPCEVLKRAVDAIGGQSATARLLGISQQAVSRWLKGRKPLPVQHVAKVEQETGIPRHVLRPDIFVHEAAEVSADPATRFEAAR